jgi:Flp pilus assembly protein TadG
MLMNFFRSREGNFTLISGLVAVPLFLAVGMAVDYSNMSRVRTDLQQALDAASMQIAFEATSGKTDAELEAFGDEAMLANLDSNVANAATPPQLHYYGIVTDSDGSQSLSTSADYQYQLMIIGAVLPGSSTRTISVRSKIKSAAGDPACVYALNHTAARAVEVSGGAKISMDGCVIASNSNDDESIYAGGSSNIHADCAQAVGQINTGTSMTVDCDSMRENAWTLDDPFDDIPAPSRPMALSKNPKNKDTTMAPGRYQDVTLDGTKTLSPGVYYIEGSLTIHGDITGSGVFIYMANGALTVNGNASLNLQAPTEDDIKKYPTLGLDNYAGMLFMNGRTNTNTMSFNGTGSTNLDGFVYSPAGDVDYSGNNGTTSTCLRIVADTIKLTGSTNMKSDCSLALGGREADTSGPFYFSL